MGVGETDNLSFDYGEDFLKKPYPGRGLIVGYNNGVSAAVYFLTGRKPSSQARVLEQKDNVVYTKSTDSKLLSEGNPELLLYNAVMFLDDLLVVSNGRQTDTVFSEQLVRKESVLDNFKQSLSQWSYEDDRHDTPRIAGVIKGEEAYVGMIKRFKGYPFSMITQVPKGDLVGVSTYDGVDADPLMPGWFFKLGLELPEHFSPLHMGGPSKEDVSFTAKRLGDYIWDLLNPNYRVSLVSIVDKYYIFPSALGFNAPLSQLAEMGSDGLVRTSKLDVYIKNK